MSSEDITPKAFKCEAHLTCPSIHKVDGGVVMKSEYRSNGELKSLGIPSATDGESAVFYTDAFFDAFVKEYVAKRWLNKTE